jgi:hypothetical protein
VPDAIAANPEAKTFVVLAGTNDVASYLYRPLASIEMSLTQIYAALRASGIRIVAVTVPQSTGFNATQNALRDSVNAWILSQAAPDLTPVNIESSYNPATQSGDGVHPNSSGAYGIGRTIADAMIPLAVAGDFFSTGDPSGDLNTSFDMTGTGGSRSGVSGVVPTGYSITNGCGSGVTVSASEASLNGSSGTTITIAGMSNSACVISFQDSGYSVAAAAGDLYEGFAQISAAPSPAGVDAFGLDCAGGHFFNDGAGTGSDPLWGANAFTGVLRTIPVPVSAGTLSLQTVFRVRVQANVAAHFSITLANWGYRRQQ